MKKVVLNVIYQSDDNYAMVSGASIASLLENNSHLDEINIFYCNYEIKTQNIKRLESIVDRYKNGTITFIDTVKYHQIFQNLGVTPWHGVYVTWLKLLAFGDLKLKTDRVLFLNGHTIVNGSLHELTQIDLGDNVMALAYDCLLNEHKRTIGLREDEGYYNCGIMLINHRVWQKERLSEVIKAHLRKRSDYVIADQDLCNVLFRGRIVPLDSTYNFSSAYYAYDLKLLLRTNSLKPEYFYNYEEIMANYYSPKIIHSLFGMKGKPWESGNEHPQRYLWRKYISLTPWVGETLPAARRSLGWYLYDFLPKGLFMKLYQMSVRAKYGKAR